MEVTTAVATEGGTGRQKGGEGGEEANAKSLLPPSWRRRSHDARFQWHLLAQSKEGNQGRKEQQQIDGTRRRKEKETTREKRAMASVPSSSPSYSQPSPHRLLPKKKVSISVAHSTYIRICSIFADLKGGGCFFNATNCFMLSILPANKRVLHCKSALPYVQYGAVPGQFPS